MFEDSIELMFHKCFIFNSFYFVESTYILHIEKEVQISSESIHIVVIVLS